MTLPAYAAERRYLGVVLFSSLAVLDPRVGHTMDVLSPLMLSIQAVRGLLAFVHLALFLALSLSPGNSLVSLWCYHQGCRGYGDPDGDSHGYGYRVGKFREI